MNAQLEIQARDPEVEDMALQIGGILTDAFTLLIERRDRQYTEAIEPLDAERETLEQESRAIGETRRNLIQLLPAKVREAQRAADALMVAGDAEGAEAKLTEAEEAANAPGAMSERQRDITTRIEAIDREKGAVARRIFEAWYLDAQRVIRAAETGLLVTLLNGVEESVIDYQARTGVEGTLMKLGHIRSLTADERSAEWSSATRWYGGRVR
jgi:hypothetical protein